jgi:hypothetical protein
MDFPSLKLPNLAPGDPSQLGFPNTTNHHPAPQQAYAVYGVEIMPMFTIQAHGLSGQTATRQNNAPYFSSLSPALLSQGQHDVGSVDNAQSEFAAPAASMGPPSQPRKKKAMTLRANDWEPYRERILQLHVEEKVPLLKAKKMIEDEHGFKAEYVAPAHRRQTEPSDVLLTQARQQVAAISNTYQSVGKGQECKAERDASDCEEAPEEEACRNRQG